MKSQRCMHQLRLARRTPQGVRGLKWMIRTQHHLLMESHPARGAWIEIAGTLKVYTPVVSHPARGAWIEI